jgi:hypothetical protein
MLRKVIHVVPNPKGGWAAKDGGSGSLFITLDLSKTPWIDGLASRQQQLEFIIHQKAGVIRNMDSHMHYPYLKDKTRPKFSIGTYFRKGKL